MSSTIGDERVLQALRNYWGYETLRPMQREAIEAGIAERDSLVVLPTGGGKSLCYQIPPLVAERTDVVISPLIALMKDQVDGLQSCGYPAAALFSGQSLEEQNGILDDLRAGHLRLLFVAPERLFSSRLLGALTTAGVGTFAIDEAHCISHWGHDFRPEYRRLATLRGVFPDAALHAFTATATERVRADILAQLDLRDPRVLVGDFDRPNLTYRVIPRESKARQVAEVLARHRDQAAIVYCITRRETEQLAAALQKQGVRADHYHAGMSPDARRRTQEAFSTERLDVIVATVAFGMGIDRGDVRCVVHAGCPKSVEHYQQEAGRAGRDGLEAECVLLYHASDLLRWESLIRGSGDQAEVDPQVVEATLDLLGHIRRYANALRCRHAMLVEYFGQQGPDQPCGACDVCLDEVAGLEDGTVLAQKILSCVARVEQRFGAEYVVDVLKGEPTERIQQFGHERLSTYGLCRDIDRKVLKRRVYELLDQGLLTRAAQGLPVLHLTRTSLEVLRGQRPVQFRVVTETKVRRTRTEAASWEGVDEDLFHELRALRKQIAAEKSVPAYVVFGDVTLRDIARRKPATEAEFQQVHGIGAKKAAQYGPAVLACVAAWNDRH